MRNKMYSKLIVTVVYSKIKQTKKCKQNKPKLYLSKNKPKPKPKTKTRNITKPKTYQR